ncbi:hypothetical protein EJ04DRAFT_553514 [Polyplosphaeria fusca]|uniref:Uncharacterized protein n=1 Tax=Polyplosphaeria fusca TaxID=682080 RepID=A0A9P4QXW9_9PLEO|nr:hypothetical protein EJ04DRAFT_553514 [Polyplosphaeria fusca]
MRIFLDQSQSCSSGEQWYVCAPNGFTGCCAVDACTQSDGCPDSDSPASSTPSSASTPPLTSNEPTPPPASPTTVQSQASSVREESSPPTSASLVQTIASVSEGQTVFITVTRDPTSTVQPPGALPTNEDRPEGGSVPVAPIAGGVVGGVVVLAIVLFLLFFARRRKSVRETKRATLPPSYADMDMSEHLRGATNGDAVVAGTIKRSETIIDEKTGRKDDNDDAVPQLDSTMIRPTNELGGEPMDNFAELPASDMTKKTTAASVAGPAVSPRKSNGGDEHIMSWAQYNSASNRDPSARLSYPHDTPDASAAVWSNMSPTTIRQEPKRDTG